MKKKFKKMKKRKYQKITETVSLKCRQKLSQKIKIF